MVVSANRYCNADVTPVDPVTHAAQAPGSSSLPVSGQPGLWYAPPAKVAGVVHEVTTASCASDRQVFPVSAPPAQRSVAGSNVHAAGLETTPSTMPSLPSHASRTALASKATLAVLKAPPAAAWALAVRLKAPMKPT